MFMQQGCWNHAGDSRKDGEENCRLDMCESSLIDDGDKSGERVRWLSYVVLKENVIVF